MYLAIIAVIYPIFYFSVIFCFFLIVYLSKVSYDVPKPSVIFNTLIRDLVAAFRFFKLYLYLKGNQYPVCENLRKIVAKHPDKVCFIFEDKKWTYQQVEDYSNQIANYFAANGYQKGDEIALFMENKPEYVMIWLGLSKIGVISALINTNLRLSSLAHSVNVIDCKAIIFGSELSSAVKDAMSLFDNKEKMELYCHGKCDAENMPEKTIILNDFLDDASKSSPLEMKSINFGDKLFYIYTSGTTGLPKAAIVRHSRFLFVGAAAKFILIIHPDDVFYTPLPLYHSAGGILFISLIFTFGGTMVIRRKFSASNFWSDAIKYQATVSQYIGEMCRFLLSQPKKPEDTQHKIRLIVGNGLRSQIWKEFAERFRIKEIIELYGSTEGNSNIVNLFGKVGAVGFISRIFSRLHPVRLIRINPETGEPVRDENGLCIRCKPGEPGELVGKINRRYPITSFDGYLNTSATQKKIIRDCFLKGDMAFRSGDILVMDEDGYLYFIDRTGDTFRWRGENVSTNEVEGIISKALGLIPCVVYAVQIPGVEGSAGMAAIEAEEREIDATALHKEISKNLPSYAMPVFLRICKSIEATGTFKMKKTDLRKEGYDPSKVSDPLFFLHPQKRKYVKLNKEMYNNIISGSMRL